jgi:hypothetical protein
MTTTTLNLVARHNDGSVKILKTVQSLEPCERLKSELYQSIGDDITAFLKACNYRSSTVGVSVYSIDVMTTKEFYDSIREYKMSLPPKEISQTEYIEYLNLATPFRAGKQGFIIDCKPSGTRCFTNMGENCFMESGIFYKKYVSLSEISSWIV